MKPELYSSLAIIVSGRRWHSVNNECILVKGKVTAKLWKIAENLHRSNLTKLQRSEQILEWRRLKEKRQKAAQASTAGGHQPSDKGVSSAARQLDLSRDDVRRSDVIARISSKAKKAAEAAELGNNQAALLRIGKEASPEKQLRKIGEIQKGGKRGKTVFTSSEREQFEKISQSV